MNHQEYHRKWEAVFFLKITFKWIEKEDFCQNKRIQKSFQDKIPTEREVLYNDILNVRVFDEGSRIGYLSESNNEEVLCKHVQTALQKPRKKIQNKIATKAPSSPFGNLVYNWILPRRPDHSGSRSIAGSFLHFGYNDEGMVTEWCSCSSLINPLLSLFVYGIHTSTMYTMQDLHFWTHPWLLLQDSMKNMHPCLHVQNIQLASPPLLLTQGRPFELSKRYRSFALLPSRIWW